MNTKQQLEQARIAVQILEAEAAGRPVEWEARCILNQCAQKDCKEWQKANKPLLDMLYRGAHELRIKPFTLSNSINGHTLSEGQQWHRSDFTAEMLPAPYRPMIFGETGWGEMLQAGLWLPLDSLQEKIKTSTKNYHCRTTRPLPPVEQPPAPIPTGYIELPDSEKKGQWIEGGKWWNGKEWSFAFLTEIGCNAYEIHRIIIPHRWMKEMQAFEQGEKVEKRTVSNPHDQWKQLLHVVCFDDKDLEFRIHDPYCHLKSALAEGKAIQAKAHGEWHDEDFNKLKLEDFSPNFLRIKPTPVLVPLEPRDVPPGSVLRSTCWVSWLWIAPVFVFEDGITWVRHPLYGSQTVESLLYSQLMEEWEFNRSIPLTGKWDATAWEACSKVKGVES